MVWDVEETWRGVMAPGPLGRDGRCLLCWVYCLEGKESGRGQNKGESQEVEACRRERQKEVNGVLEATLRWDSG